MIFERIIHFVRVFQLNIFSLTEISVFMHKRVILLKYKTQKEKKMKNKK